MSDDLLHRIDEEFADDSPEGLVEIADSRRTHLFISGGNTTSIMEGSYQDNPGSDFPSEFDHLLDNYARADANSPANDLDMHVRVRDIEQAEANAIAPFACINPASFDRGNLGQSVLLKAGALVNPLIVSIFADGEEQMVAFWPGEAREACPVTVTAAPVLPYSAGIVRAVAVIKWGVHGAKFEVEVDLGTGFSLTINASNVYLSLYLEGGTFTGGSGAATMVDQIVAGSIGFQQADHQQPVVRSVPSAGTVAAAGTFTVLRPAFATSLLSFERGDISGPTTLAFRDQNGTTRFTRQYGALVYIDTPISLPGEIASILVTNGGAAATNINLVFGLF